MIVTPIFITDVTNFSKLLWKSKNASFSIKPTSVLVTLVRETGTTPFRN